MVCHSSAVLGKNIGVFINQLILEENDFNGDLITLDPSDFRSKHLKEILKVSIGDSLRFTHVNVGKGTLQVKSISDQIVLKVLDFEKIHNINENGPIFLIGVSRPPTVKKILEYGTTIGVKEFWFYKGDLSEKSYLTSKIFEEKELNHILNLGLSQSKTYTHRPKVLLFNKLDDALKSLSQNGNRILLEQKGEMSLFDHMYSLETVNNLVLGIGSERGMTVREIDLFLKDSFTMTTVSNSTLRVEFACYYALIIREQFLISNKLKKGN